MNTLTKLSKKAWVKAEHGICLCKERVINHLSNDRGSGNGVGPMVWMIVAVGVAVIVWGLVSGWLPTFWNKIIGKADTLG